MKVVRLVLIMVVVLSAAMSVNAQKKNEKTVIFNANLHCESCKAKVEKNIPYEKGVKDLKVDMKTQTITYGQFAFVPDYFCAGALLFLLAAASVIGKLPVVTGQQNIVNGLLRRF